MEGITLYSISYYERSVFKGSYKGMNFYLRKGGGETPALEAVAWKGPYAYDCTKEEKTMKEFSFSDDGIREADAWLMEQQKLLIPSS